MKDLKSLLTLAISTTLAMVLVSGCERAGSNTSISTPAKELEKQTLVMGTSADAPPYEYHDTSNGQDKIVGFDIDIANRLAEELGFTIEVKDQDFNGLIPALQAKRVDFVMAGMTATDERRKSVDFSDIYYKSKLALVTKKGSSLAKVEDLAGKKIGAQLGSLFENQAKDVAKTVNGVEVVSLSTIGELIQQVKTSRLDAVFMADTVAKGYVKTNPDIEFKIIETGKPPAGAAIAFPKGSELVDDFNKVLKEMSETGEMDALIVKWFEKQE